MKLLLERLRSYVPRLEAPPEEVAARLTLAGVAVERLLGSGADLVLETDITTNRPNLLSYVGTAREVAAVFGLPLLPPGSRPGESRAGVVPGSAAPPGAAADETASAATLRVEAPDLCPRYVLRVVRGVRVGPSPDWLRREVEAAGIRSINNVVDVTNFVLLETGQPLHAFDLARLEGAAIVVRRPRSSERLRTLDGADRVLAPDDLVIADASRAVALAGVMGGADAEISAATADLLLESAWFEPKAIWRTSRRHRLRTEASLRFERGADPEAAGPAADRAAALVAEVAGGRVLGGRVEALVTPRPRPRVVSLRLARLGALLGAEVPGSEAERVLEALGFRLSSHPPPGTLEATVPSFRADVEREVDLIEEVGRIRGYGRIPSRLPRTDLVPAGRSPEQRRERIVRELLEGAGWSEAVTLSMVDPTLERLALAGGSPAASGMSGPANRGPAVGDAAAAEPVPITNPLSASLSALRGSAVGGLLAAAGHNLRRGAEGVALYEIVRVFRARSRAARIEHLHLGLLAAGQAPTAPGEKARPFEALDLKGLLERVVEGLRLPPLRARTAASVTEPSALSLDERPWGHLRMASAELLDAHGIDRNVPVHLAEVDLDAALAIEPPPVVYRPLSPYPASTRDVSLFVRGASYADVLSAIEAVPEPLLEGARLINLYQSTGAGDGRRSLALRLTYRHAGRTLEADEVHAAHARILAALERDGRLELRVG